MSKSKVFFIVFLLSLLLSLSLSSPVNAKTQKTISWYNDICMLTASYDPGKISETELKGAVFFVTEIHNLMKDIPLASEFQEATDKQLMSFKAKIEETSKAALVTLNKQKLPKDGEWESLRSEFARDFELTRFLLLQQIEYLLSKDQKVLPRSWMEQEIPPTCLQKRDEGKKKKSSGRVEPTNAMAISWSNCVNEKFRNSGLTDKSLALFAKLERKYLKITKKVCDE